MAEAIADEVLVQNARRGDKDSFARLYERYRDEIFSFVYRLSGSTAFAESVTHDCFLKIKGGKRFSHPLYILNKLTSADEYRMLALTFTCRPHPTFLLDESNGRMQIQARSITEPFQDGARFSQQRLTGIQTDEVVMHIQRGIYLQFKDLPWPDSGAETVLGKVVGFVKDQVVPRFEPFFDQPFEGSVYVPATHKRDVERPL